MGNFGEYLAGNYLEKKGFKIINKNYSSRYGEVDIVAEKNNSLVFVEVKLRKKNSKVSGGESVNSFKQRKIIKTALVYISNLKKDLNARFDVVEICGGVDNHKITHLENAFTLNDVYLGAA